MSNSILKSILVGAFYTKIKVFFSNDKLSARRREKMYINDIIDVNLAHSKMKELINSENPIMIARYGFNEAAIVGMNCFYNKFGFFPRRYGKIGKFFYSNAGFFSKDGTISNSDIDKFARLITEDAGYADMIGIHYGLFEDYLINAFSPKAILTEFNNLRIMASDDSWGKALTGKKVLIVYPFEKSIRNQYQRIEKVWNGLDIVPNFELVTYKPVQSIAYNKTVYKDWFEALNKMKADIAKIDFDIAIIGAGAYGFPLAAECKRMGKKAIHLGGQTQLIFGILGKRYEEIEYYKKFINEYWVHPLEEEKPKSYSTIEGGCYW